MNRTRLVVLAMIAVSLMVAVPTIAWINRRSNSLSEATRLYRAGNLNGALAVLRDKPLGEKQLYLIASCFRQLGQARDFQATIDRMRSAKGPATEESMGAWRDLALAMDRIQRGQAAPWSPGLVETLEKAGAFPDDARSVVVQGGMALRRFQESEDLLQKWDTIPGPSVQRNFLRAGFHSLMGRREQAEGLLRENLTQFPDHELSGLALAELFSRPPEVQFDKARQILEGHLRRFGDQADVKIRLARILRRSGIPDPELISPPTPYFADTPPAIDGEYAVERAHGLFDAGRFQGAREQLEQAGWGTDLDLQLAANQWMVSTLNGSSVQADELGRRIPWAATVAWLSGDTATAARAFDVLDARAESMRGLQVLAWREGWTSGSPAWRQYVDDAQKRSHPSLGAREEGRSIRADSEASEASMVSMTGWQDYQRHCAHCHGTSGHGEGRAAGNLFPAPRDFWNEPMRWVSTRARVASREDLKRTIVRGEPGTSMPSFSHLPLETVEKVVDVVQAMIRAASHPDVPSTASSTKTPSTDASSTIELDTSSSGVDLQQGAALYRSLGCQACHGSMHDKDWKGPLFHDSMGRPMRPPHLAVDPMHGGATEEDLIHRVVVGIPGTVHPAWEGPTRDIRNLVAYLVAQRESKNRDRTNAQRRLWVVEP